MKDNKHIFAIYYQNFKEEISLISDKDLIHRITHILRLNINDKLIIFSLTTIYNVIINDINNKSINVIIEKKSLIKQPEKNITLLLPLLKKDALEASFYRATLMGIKCIQLITTEKSIKSIPYNQYKDRYNRIIISAAEQSKQYFLPTIKDPILLEEALNNISENNYKIFADAQGEWLHTELSKIHLAESIIVCIGPEGDMTKEEKEALKKKNFNFYKFNKSILKSEDALIVLIGIIRALN